MPAYASLGAPVERVHYRSEFIATGQGNGGYGDETWDGVEVDNPDDANLISSRLADDPDMHAPVIDLDFPCRLVESSTSGHYHLYLDRAVTADAYHALLEALEEAGLVEPGFVRQLGTRGGTMVRKPGVLKWKVAA